ncbi:MAG: type II toxin-antitoxin system Phd/YefM family antitoxin [Planctomycetes bacterium]|nr:type II toxin-antitoxin system Phd/YefM family antitoxin [Planctomycetota bacterium]
MRYVSVRELRNRAAKVWRVLEEDQDLVITSNGKPVALLTSVSEDSLEGRIAALRRARAAAAVEAIQETSAREGRSTLPPAAIDAEIAAARKGRRR